jgi:hypothetical protein
MWLRGIAVAPAGIVTATMYQSDVLFRTLVPFAGVPASSVVRRTPDEWMFHSQRDVSDAFVSLATVRVKEVAERFIRYANVSGPTGAPLSGAIANST